MIRRWNIQCFHCESTDLAYEMDDGDMVYLEDIKHLIAVLNTSVHHVTKEVAQKHDEAVYELRTLLS